MKPRERARVLNKIADTVEPRKSDLAELETFDTGLPITQAKGQACAQPRTSASSRT